MSGNIIIFLYPKEVRDFSVVFTMLDRSIISSWKYREYLVTIKRRQLWRCHRDSIRCPFINNLSMALLVPKAIISWYSPFLDCIWSNRCYLRAPDSSMITYTTSAKCMLPFTFHVWRLSKILFIDLTCVYLLKTKKKNKRKILIDLSARKFFILLCVK